MRIVSKEYKIYKFDELNDDVRKELIEKERDNQREMYCDCWLEEDMNYKAKGLLYTYLGANDVDVSPLYDLSYCQGSGAMMVFDINIETLNNKYKIYSDEEMRFLIEKDVIDYIKIKHNNDYYYHEYSFKIDCFYNNNWEYDDIKEDYKITESDFNTLEDRFYELVDDSNKHNTKSQFIKDIISMNKELTRYGYNCIEYYWNCDEEEIISYINGYEYLENGDVFYE